MALVLTVLWPRPARAQYMDPGASSLVVQLVIAGVAGAAVLIKLYWVRLSALVRRLLGRRK